MARELVGHEPADMPHSHTEHPGDLLDPDETDGLPAPAPVLHDHLPTRPSPLNPTYARRTAPNATDPRRIPPAAQRLTLP
ncbi:MAG: hypothetical protein LC792_26250 [Actinobacteria bacterium]|nr:hypothetical protein [Actinomycetota bacterium]